MNPRSLKVTQNAYFSFLTHTKILLSVTFCDWTAETGGWTEEGWRTKGQTDAEVEIVI